MFLDYQLKGPVQDNLQELTEKNLRHLSLTGRHGYLQQGFAGKTSTIAVVDTGVNPEHPELKGRIVDLLNYCGYGQGKDDAGHGTHVAGTIAGANVGIAPETKILSVKVLDGGGGGNFSNICKALEDLKDWQGKDRRKLTAVSMSLSAPESFFRKQPGLLERFEAAIKNLTEAGIAVICSAGNTGRQEKRYPAYFHDPITVGAVDVENLEPAGFSTESKEVDLCQCGVDILSAWYQGGYRIMSGTSMATPVIPGIAALIADKFYQTFGESIPEMVLYWMLKMNCKDIGVKGLDSKTGAGFCSLQPVKMDLHTKVKNKHWTLNGENQKLRAPIAVVKPGVTSLPARELTEQIFGGIVEYDPATKFARFRM